RLGHRRLAVVDHAGMAASDILKKPYLGAELLKTRCQLPRMARMNTVIGTVRGQENRRIVAAAFDQLVGRETADELPLRGIVRIAVFGNPALTGEQLGVARHVEQRHVAPDRSE